MDVFSGLKLMFYSFNILINISDMLSGQHHRRMAKLQLLGLPRTRDTYTFLLLLLLSNRYNTSEDFIFTKHYFVRYNNVP